MGQHRQLLSSDAGREIVGGFFDVLVPGLTFAKLGIGESTEI